MLAYDAPVLETHDSSDSGSREWQQGALTRKVAPRVRRGPEPISTATVAGNILLCLRSTSCLESRRIHVDGRLASNAPQTLNKVVDVGREIPAASPVASAPGQRCQRSARRRAGDRRPPGTLGELTLGYRQPKTYKGVCFVTSKEMPSPACRESQVGRRASRRSENALGGAERRADRHTRRAGRYSYPSR